MRIKSYAKYAVCVCMCVYNRKNASVNTIDDKIGENRVIFTNFFRKLQLSIRVANGLVRARAGARTQVRFNLQNSTVNGLAPYRAIKFCHTLNAKTIYERFCLLRISARAG